MKVFSHSLGLALLLGASFSAQASPQAHIYELPCSQNCTGTMISASETVSGAVTYRERIALPPNAIVRVTLESVSSPMEVLAEQTIETQGKQVPIPFSLTYDASKIQAETSYVIRAQILVDQQLRFSGETVYLADSREKVEVIVRSITPSPR